MEDDEARNDQALVDILTKMHGYLLTDFKLFDAMSSQIWIQSYSCSFSLSVQFEL